MTTTILTRILQAITSRQAERPARLEDFTTNEVISYVMDNAALKQALIGPYLQSSDPLANGIKPVIDSVTDITGSGTISKSTLSFIITAMCGFGTSMRLSDNTYQLVDEDKAVEFFERMAIDELKWQADGSGPLSVDVIGDCDEFMFAAAGLANIRSGRVAFGVASNGSHAFNVCVNTNGNLRFFEPQTNVFTDITKETGVKFIWM